MPRPDSPSFVLPSLIDRLMQDRAPVSSDAALSRAQSVRQLRAAVRRDLEWLLNTRCTHEAPPEEMEHLRSSLYMYGLPDFSNYTVTSPQDRARLFSALQRTIEMFEPRLSDVTVSPVESGAPNVRTLRFLVTGLLRTEPFPEQVAFDTVLEPSRGEYRVKEE